MFLIAILMALLTSRRLSFVDSLQLHLSEAAPLDAATLNDYPELMGILANLLNEDGEKCLDMSVDCSDFPAGACEANSKEDDLDLPRNYCQKVICCTEEFAREKLAFTSGGKPVDSQLSSIAQHVNDGVSRTNRRSQVVRDESRQRTSNRNDFFDNVQQTRPPPRKSKTLKKSPKNLQFQSKELRLPRKLPESQPHETATTVSDQIGKSSNPNTISNTMQPVEVSTSKRQRTKAPTRKKSKKFQKPFNSKVATTSLPSPTTSLWEDTTVAVITDTTEHPIIEPKQTNKSSSKEHVKNVQTSKADNDESKSTTVIKDFTTPKSFREMWHEKGSFPKSDGPTPQESQQRYEVEQNFLELCGAIVAHAGSPENDLKANGAICYEDYAKPQRGRTRTKTPTRKLAKGTMRKEAPTVLAENPYKPRGWPKKPVRPLKEPPTQKRPRQRQQVPAPMNPFPKRPASGQRPIYPVESETQEDYTEDGCDDESANGNGGDGNFETQLNSYSDNSQRDEFVGAVKNYRMDELNRNSLYDELDDGDFDRILNEGYDKSEDKSRRRLSGAVPGAWKTKKPAKPPSVYLSNIVKPSRGRQISVPSHDFRELRLFGKFYNHRGELCDEPSKENPKLNGQQADSGSTLEDNEDLTGSKRKFRLKDDQDELSSESEESQSYSKYKSRQRGRERQGDVNFRYANNFT